MTSQERKTLSEIRLRSIGIVLHDDLPPLQDEDYVIPRSAAEIAERVMILTYLNVSATDQSLRQQIMMFLIHEKLWNKVTEDEKQLLHKSRLSDEDLTTIFWRSESIWALLWAIQKIDTLELPQRSADLQAIFPLIPGFLESPSKFIQDAAIRDVSELMDQYDFLFRLNWALRQDPAAEGSAPVDEGVAHERFTALDWLLMGTDSY